MKPEKPYPGFPLYPHGNKQWAAKVAGVRMYFGPWSDPEGALRRYQEQVALKVKAKARAGAKAKPSDDGPLWQHKGSGQWCKVIKGVRTYWGRDQDEALRRYQNRDKPIVGEVRPATPGALTIHELTCRFLTSQKTRVDLRELGQRTWDGYKEVCDVLIAKFSKERAVSSLGPLEFANLLEDYRKPRKLGLVSIGNFILRTRVVFNYGKRNGLLTTTVFGDVFRKPSKSALRRERQGKPKKLFKAIEIRRLLKAASPQLRAMILLGINCGFEPHDCGGLEERHLDLEGGWVNYPRPKTTVDRRSPLWRITVRAIKAVLEDRPEPKNPEHAGRVFLTRCRVPWEQQSAVSCEFTKLLRKTGVKEAALKDHRRLCFLALRHTFQTVGEKARDKDAVRAMMGHSPLAGDMSFEYSEEGIEDVRLKAVASHVFNWLRKPNQSQAAA